MPARKIPLAPRSFSYSDGNVENVNLGNIWRLHRVFIFFVGTLTAAGGAADGALQTDGLLNTILKSIILRANGSVVGTVLGRSLYYLRAMLTGSAGVHVSTMPTGAASTAQRVMVVLDMDTIRSQMIRSGRFNAREMSELMLEITSGAVESDMIVGGDRTESMTGTFYVTGEGYEGPADGPGALGGGFRHIKEIRQEIIAATEENVINIPVGQRIQRILLECVDNGVRDDALISTFELLVGGSDYRLQTRWLELKADNVELFGLETSSGAHPYTGYALVELARSGNPRDWLDTRGMRSNLPTLRWTSGSPTGVAYLRASFFGVKDKVGERGANV